MELTDIAVIRRLCAAHGFSLSKGLGQNFIVNPGVCPKIVEASGIDETYGALEIGPGIGVLTKELALRARKVVAIELDTRLPALLAETLAGFSNIRVVQGDALKLDLAALIRQEFPGMKVAVCANLPYYITSPLVMKLLEDKLPLQHITVMVQKEAAQRLAALPGTREAGPFLSINRLPDIGTHGIGGDLIPFPGAYGQDGRTCQQRNPQNQQHDSDPFRLLFRKLFQTFHEPVTP